MWKNIAKEEERIQRAKKLNSELEDFRLKLEENKQKFEEYKQSFFDDIKRDMLETFKTLTANNEAYKNEVVQLKTHISIDRTTFFKYSINDMDITKDKKGLLSNENSIKNVM